MSEKLNNDDLDQVTGGDTIRIKFAYYTTEVGDSIVWLAHYYKTTEQAILEYNPIITNHHYLGSGWILKIPDNR